MEKSSGLKMGPSGLNQDIPSLPGGLPTAIAPLVVVFSERPVPLPIGVTLSQVELACWQDRQEKVQTSDFDCEFVQTHATSASRRNGRRGGTPTGHQNAFTAKGNACPNFPDRAGNGGTDQVPGEEATHHPPATVEVKIIKDLGITG
jgi:hypothetical protein